LNEQVKGPPDVLRFQNENRGAVFKNCILPLKGGTKPKSNGVYDKLTTHRHIICIFCKKPRRVLV
jgi:hypothetical protein